MRACVWHFPNGFCQRSWDSQFSINLVKFSIKYIKKWFLVKFLNRIKTQWIRMIWFTHIGNLTVKNSGLVSHTDRYYSTLRALAGVEKWGIWADQAKTLVFSILAVSSAVCTVLNKLMRNYCRHRQWWRRRRQWRIIFIGLRRQIVTEKRFSARDNKMISHNGIFFFGRTLFGKYTHLCTNSKLAWSWYHKTPST